MRLTASNILLMFRALERVVVDVKVVSAGKKGTITITHPQLQLGWVVDVKGFDSHLPDSEGVIKVSGFRPGDTFNKEELLGKAVTYDGASNVAVLNDMVTRTAKFILAALMPVALNEKRDEIKVNETG